MEEGTVDTVFLFFINLLINYIICELHINKKERAALLFKEQSIVRIVVVR